MTMGIGEHVCDQVHDKQIDFSRSANNHRRVCLIDFQWRGTEVPICTECLFEEVAYFIFQYI